jgi:hypothetical protein
MIHMARCRVSPVTRRPQADQSAGAFRQLREFRRVELWYRLVRLWRGRLFFTEYERSLKEHSRHLFCRPDINEQTCQGTFPQASASDRRRQRP